MSSRAATSADIAHASHKAVFWWTGLQTQKGHRKVPDHESSLSIQTDLKGTPSFHPVSFNTRIKNYGKEEEYTIRFREEFVGCCVLQKYENITLFFGLDL